MAVTEIAPDVYRISTYIPEIDLQFNQFLVKDEEPLLFHTGMKSLFPTVLEATKSIIDPSRIRWIGFSHFEADECGALNEWLQTAPAAQPVCSMVGALVSINDFAIRPARGRLIAKRSTQVSTASASVKHHTYRIVGKQDFCSRR